MRHTDSPSARYAYLRLVCGMLRELLRSELSAEDFRMVERVAAEQDRKLEDEVFSERIFE